MQKANEECHTNFKRTKSRDQVTEALDNFVESNPHIVVSVTFTRFHLLDGIYCSTLVNLPCFSTVGLSETVEATTPGLGDFRLFQST